MCKGVRLPARVQNGRNSNLNKTGSRLTKDSAVPTGSMETAEHKRAE